MAFDEEGYPDTATLKRMREWTHELGHPALMEYVRDHWLFAESGYWRRRGRFYVLATAGWSGNEDIILALQENLVFWHMCWRSSRRGGRHVFEVKESGNG